MGEVFSLIRDHSFLWEKAEQTVIFVQNLSERMSFLERLNCNAAEESYRLIMAQYVNLFRGLEEWPLIVCHKQKYKCV